MVGASIYRRKRVEQKAVNLRDINASSTGETCPRGRLASVVTEDGRGRQVYIVAQVYEKIHPDTVCIIDYK